MLPSSRRITKIRLDRFARPRSVSAVRAPYTLDSDQPEGSPIDTSRAGEGLFEDVDPDHFQLWPGLLAPSEQAELLQASLSRLDLVFGISRACRARRKIVAQSLANDAKELGTNFLPEECYEFETGHYDGVINKYREALISSWPQSTHPILEKLLALMPGFPSQSSVHIHALHLASAGEILPHVDNVEASGTTIVGVSLGTSRVMRLQRQGTEAVGDAVDVLLEPGSVYLQRDSVRYKLVHSVPHVASFRGLMLRGGQRLSVMIRDRPIQL